MPSQASSSPLAATLLALWLALGRSGASAALRPGCDNGKLYLDRDLPAHSGYWGCPTPSRPESTQRPQSVDTVFDPEPARQICMDHRISYNRSIPNSGAFRPVMAESGEYLYCPPQRWLNNLHHGAIVLLYHPCAVVRERGLLSGLARSCLPGHILTPHPQLSRDMPIALVSWGRSLELTTVASSDVCDWLHATQTAGNKVSGRPRTRKYDLLLTRPAGLQHLGPSTGTKDSVKQCCERTISSLLRGTTGPGIKKDYLKQMKEGRKDREIRAAAEENWYASERTDKKTNGFSRIKKTVRQRTRAAQNHSSSDSLLGQSPHSAASLPRQTAQTLPSTPTPLLASHTSESLLQISSSEGAKSVRDGTKRRNTSKSVQGRVQGRVKENEVVDVKEREAEPNQKQTNKPLPTKLDSASHSQSEIDRQSGGDDCSDCADSSRAERRGAVVNVGLQRTPRTDEAVWAAAALGFLLVLLTLSILHTRLYRHWRTTPSLYWHDPQQDYDSVADVIRRRLRIAKTRRKRSRRKECVLLPSSSSSDDNP